MWSRSATYKSYVLPPKQASTCPVKWGRRCPPPVSPDPPVRQEAARPEAWGRRCQGTREKAAGAGGEGAVPGVVGGRLPAAARCAPPSRRHPEVGPGPPASSHPTGSCEEPPEEGESPQPPLGHLRGRWLHVTSVSQAGSRRVLCGRAAGRRAGALGPGQAAPLGSARVRGSQLGLLTVNRCQ